MASSWTPILSGSLQEETNQALFSIADSLRDVPIQDASLMNGAAGLALFFAYLAEAFPDRGYEEPASTFLHRAVGGLDPAMGTSLHSGVLGVAWTTEHLRKRWGVVEGDDPNRAVDAYLHRCLDSATRSVHFDLILGLVGWGVYSLERLPAPSAASALERIVDLLIHRADQLPRGLAWWSPPSLRGIPGRGQVEVPGCYDIGVAHGAAGVIAFLSEASSRMASLAPAAETTARAVSWLCAQRRPGTGIAFPAKVEPGSTEVSGFRSVWCYGDVGVSAALLGAARNCHRADWEATAREVARAAAVRSPKDSGVSDACFCHGGAGQLHVFTRLYHATQEPLFREAAQAWTQYTLAQRRGSEGIAGFLTWKFDQQGNESWRGLPGVLEGVAGVGLALLAAASAVEPNWDRTVLVSVAANPEDR